MVALGEDEGLWGTCPNWQDADQFLIFAARRTGGSIERHDAAPHDIAHGAKHPPYEIQLLLSGKGWGLNRADRDAVCAAGADVGCGTLGVVVTAPGTVSGPLGRSIKT